MAETRHTPGPWVASHPMQDSGGNFAIEIGGKVAAGPISVAWVMLGASPTPQERADGQADARLIAAAPELLEALRRLAQVVASIVFTRDDAGTITIKTREVVELGGPLMLAHQAAEAAIAKAEGR